MREQSPDCILCGGQVRKMPPHDGFGRPAYAGAYHIDETASRARIAELEALLREARQMLGLNVEPVVRVLRDRIDAALGDQ